MTVADACPGILDLHEARDGYVARIRLPGGYAVGSRLRALAALASHFGNGYIDLTSRSNVQLRGIQVDRADELARRAAVAGLLPSPTHDRARNITASPLAGLAGHHDLRTLVHALDRGLRADPSLAALSGRFLFSLDDGTGRAGLGGCDVGLRRRAGGADLIVAGRETGLHGPAGPAVGQAIAAARNFLRKRRDAPETARIAGLPDGGGAVVAALGGVLGDAAPDESGRLPLGSVPDAAPLAVVGAPLARLTAQQLRLIGRMVRPGEAARLTAAGRVVLPLAEPVDAALTRLADAGLLVSDDDALSTVTACSGMSCVKSLADVRSLATHVPGQVAVHWVGCGRRCGLPADAAAVIATAADAFAITGAPGVFLPIVAAGPR